MISALDDGYPYCVERWSDDGERLFQAIGVLTTYTLAEAVYEAAKRPSSSTYCAR